MEVAGQLSVVVDSINMYEECDIPYTGISYNWVGILFSYTYHLKEKCSTILCWFMQYDLLSMYEFMTVIKPLSVKKTKNSAGSIIVLGDFTWVYSLVEKDPQG